MKGHSGQTGNEKSSVPLSLPFEQPQATPYLKPCSKPSCQEWQVGQQWGTALEWILPKRLVWTFAGIKGYMWQDKGKLKELNSDTREDQEYIGKKVE